MTGTSGTGSGYDPDAIFQYLTGQLNASQPPLLAAFEAEGAAAVAKFHPALDVSYGPHPRQRFDFFAAPAPLGTIAYLHAGYWQARDKAQFRFLAPSVTGEGFNLAVVNYPLCPDVTVAALTEAVRDAVPAILSFAGRAQGATASLVAIGHSAGAHLAVELALSDWTGRGLARVPIDGVVGLSGVYDLEPLVATPLNDKLRLDRSAAHAASPVHRLRGGLPRALFAVGARETDAFRAQTAGMCAAWQAAGNDAALRIVDGCDHFSLLRALQHKDGIFGAVKALA